MSNNELDDLFNQINSFLGNEGQESSEGGQFDTTFSHDNEAKEDSDGDEEDKTEIFETHLRPLIERICVACQNHGIPAQFAVKCSRSQYATLAVCWEKSVQVQAAHAMYKLPHPVSHLVLFASTTKMSLPMVKEEAFTGVTVEDNEMKSMLQELVEKALEHDLPLQWGMVLNRETKSMSDLDPQTIISDSIEDAFSQMQSVLRKLLSGQDLSHQNILGGIHMSDRHHSCHMTASLAFYHAGSSLAGEIMALYEDLSEEDDAV